MGLSSRKPEGGIRFWLDPKKRDTTTPVPGWEGVYNGTPNYMDIALYCMMSLDKKQLKEAMKLHSHLSFRDILKMKKVNDVKLLTPCLPLKKIREDKIIFVNSHELGYIVGYTKFDELDTYRPPESQQKYNAALIKFENLMWEPAPVHATPTGNVRAYKPQSKILTMYDENFLLAKECQMITVDELETHMNNYF